MNDETIEGVATEQTEKLTSWKNEPTLVDLQNDLTSSKSDHTDKTTKIRKWLDNMHIKGTALVKTPEGRSKVQPKLIRKQAEWRYAALSEPFLSVDNIFKIKGIGPSDKEQAHQNSLVLNNQWNTKVKKVKFIDAYIRTAVDEGTVIVRSAWKSTEETRSVEYPVYSFREAATREEVFTVQTMMSVAQDPIKLKHIPKQWLTALSTSAERGSPWLPYKSGTETVEEEVLVENCPEYVVCENEDIIIDPSCEGDMEKAEFVIHSFESNKSKLEKQGVYKNLDKIVMGTVSPLSVSDEEEDKGFHFQDDPRKKFRVQEYWGNWDINNDGTTVPIVVAWVGQTIIRMEENPYPHQELPFTVVQYLPVKKSTHGEPDGELLIDNQKIVGAVTRGMIDVMGRSANGQTGIAKGSLDPINRRKYEAGRDYEYNPTINPAGAFHEHTFPEIPQSAPLMINMQNADAESMTGVKAFSGGISGEGLGEVATGVRGALDAASKRELGILRRLAEGIIDLGRKTIAMNAEFLEDEEVIRITEDDYRVIHRDDLAGNFDMSLDITTAEEDNAKASELAFMLQTLGPNEDPKIRQMILADIAKLRKMPELAERLETYEAQPDPLEEEIKRLEIQKLHKELAVLDSQIAKNHGSANLDNAKSGTEASKANNLDAETDKLDLEYVEESEGINHARELERMSAQSKGNAETEVVRAMLNQPTEAPTKT